MAVDVQRRARPRGAAPVLRWPRCAGSPAFARPHRRRLVAFLLLSVVGAVLAVATPVLAGRIVDAIVARRPAGTVVGLAVLIAVIAVAETGRRHRQRWLSATLGEGLILDLRAAVFDHVQRMPVAFFTRTRTGALVSRLNNDVIGAQRAFSDTLSGVVGNLVTLALTLAVMLDAVLAGHRARAGAAAGVRAAGAADRAAAGPAAAGGGRPQRGDGHPDDRAVLRAGRHAGQAVRPAGRRDPRVRRPGGAGARHRGAHRDGAVDLRLGADAGVGAGAGAGLRPRRLLRAERRDGRGRRGGAGPAAHPALRPAHRAGQRPGRRDERAGQLRAGVRGARPAAADRASRPTRGRCPTARCRSSSTPCDFAYPAADAVSLASLEEVAQLDSRAGDAGAARRVVPGRAGAAGGAGRIVGRGQVDDRPAAAPALRRRRRARSGSAGSTCATCRSTRSGPRSAWSPRTGTCSTSRSGQPAAGPAGGRPRTSSGTRCAGPGSPTSSPRCRTGWTPWSASAATGSPAASGSG